MVTIVARSLPCQALGPRPVGIVERARDRALERAEGRPPAPPAPRAPGDHRRGAPGSGGGGGRYLRKLIDG